MGGGGGQDSVPTAALRSLLGAKQSWGQVHTQASKDLKMSTGSYSATGQSNLELSYWSAKENTPLLIPRFKWGG